MLGIAFFTYFERRRHVNFHKFYYAATDDLGCPQPVNPIGRNEGRDRYHASIRHQPCNLGNPTNIFDSVFRAEGQIRIQPVPDIVTVQDVNLHLAVIELLLQGPGKG